MDLAVVVLLGLGGVGTAFLAGWLGCRGQMRALTRRVNAHDDDLEALAARMSRREGQLGGVIAQQRRRTKDELWAEALAARASATSEAGPASGPAEAPPRDHADIMRRARAAGVGLNASRSEV